MNVTPLREQIHDTVKFISVAWEEIERHLNEEDKHHDKVQPGNQLSTIWSCPHCSAEIDTQTLQLSSTDSSKLICHSRICVGSSPGKHRNKGNFWPEQRAYNVLRNHFPASMAECATPGRTGPPQQGVTLPRLTSRAYEDI